MTEASSGQEGGDAGRYSRILAGVPLRGFEVLECVCVYQGATAVSFN